MDTEAAERSATQVGLITLPIGLALLTAPSRVGRHLDGGSHDTAMRVIGALDLALVPGLIAGRHKGSWLTARAGLNMLIAAYCANVGRSEGAKGARFATAAMVGATIADGRAIAALRRTPA